jgi:nitrogen-specific signal transduction histidine kinase
MSRYWELREAYHRTYQERAALVRREMLTALNPVREELALLLSVDPARLEQVFSRRCLELLEIASDSADNLWRSVDAVAPDGRNVQSSDAMRNLRHDLRGPVGTLRGAMVMLMRAPAAPEHPLAIRALEAANRTEDLRDIIEALTEDIQREVGGRG